MTISGGPLSSTPISSLPSFIVPPPPPSIGPTHIFEQNEVKYRYGERYISEATNRKFRGIPRGVYLGFVPSFDNDVLTLSPDATYGVSLARLVSQDDNLNAIDVFTVDAVVLDFTGHTTYPVNVVLRANGALGQPYSAEIVTQVGAPIQPTEVLLGVVTAANTIDVDLPNNRDNPFAYVNAPLGYGFMPDGSAEDLINAVAMVAEVQAARTDLAGVDHPWNPPFDFGLRDRLDVDASGAVIANQLGKELRTISGETYTLAASSSSVNVSSSFANKHRTRSPLATIQGFGSESRVGAITDGTPRPFPPSGTLVDADRNVCAVIDAATERRLLDSQRRPVYGRLSLSEITLTGTLDYTATLTTVSGTLTDFQNEIEKDDIIEDGAGDYYQVDANPPSATSLDLSIPADNTNSGSGLIRRRFTLEFFVREDADTENPFVVTLGTSVRFFFPMWDSAELSQFDYLPDLFKNFDGAPVGDATTVVYGKALVESGALGATAGGLFRLLDGGSVVGDGNFSTLSFGSVATAGTGIVNVFSRGATGPKGNDAPPGVPGPQGPKGPQGVGYDYTKGVFLERSSNMSVPGTYAPGTTYNLTVVWPSFTKILFLTGGFCEWNPIGNEGDDTVDITNVEKLSDNSARVSGLVPTGSPQFNFRLFLNAGGY